MDNIYWSTDEPHADNSETMCDYLENINMLDITMVDGTYAEGVNCIGEKYEVHAGGNGDHYNHMVSFKLINDKTQEVD